MEEDTFVKVNELYQRFKVLNDWLGKIPVKTLLISQQVSSLSQSFNVMRKAVISELNATLKNAYQPYVIPLITKKLVNEVEAYLTTYTTFKDEITAITPDRLLQLQRIAKEGSAGLQSQVQNEHEKLVTEGGIFNFLQLTEADQNEFTKLRNQSRELLNELLFYVDTTKQGRIFSKESLLKQGMKNEQLTLFNFWIADEDPEKNKIHYDNTMNKLVTTTIDNAQIFSRKLGGKPKPKHQAHSTQTLLIKVNDKFQLNNNLKNKYQYVCAFFCIALRMDLISKLPSGPEVSAILKNSFNAEAKGFNFRTNKILSVDVKYQTPFKDWLTK